MIINIFREEHLPLVQELPREVKEVIKENIKILEENYGTERTVEDLGGYIAVVDEDDIETFKEKILKNTVTEFIYDINFQMELNKYQLYFCVEVISQA